MSSPGSSTAASNQTNLGSSMPSSPANGTKRNSAASENLPQQVSHHSVTTNKVFFCLNEAEADFQSPQTTNLKAFKAAEAQRLSDAKIHSWLDEREDHLRWYLSCGGQSANA
jgi:hypothetical protein